MIQFLIAASLLCSNESLVLCFHLVVPLGITPWPQLIFWNLIPSSFVHKSSLQSFDVRSNVRRVWDGRVGSVFTSLMMNQIALYWGCKGEMQSNKKPPGNRRITLKVKDVWTADSDDSPPGWLVTLQQLTIRSIYCVLLDLICIIVN